VSSSSLLSSPVLSAIISLSKFGFSVWNFFILSSPISYLKIASVVERVTSSEGVPEKEDSSPTPSVELTVESPALFERIESDCDSRRRRRGGEREMEIEGDGESRRGVRSMTSDARGNIDME
jgi:hypothetical protein